MRSAAVSLFRSVDDVELPVVEIRESAPPVSRERETSPADVVSERQTDAPSSRPTSVPDIHLQAFATLLSCSLRDTSALHVALDTEIPIRVRRPNQTQPLTFQASFFLGHVDGCSTILEIAAQAQLPVARAVVAFREMFALGIVTFASPSESPPVSGIFSAVTVEG